MGAKVRSFYNVPDKYWQRTHFVRPRFKGNIENVLLYMAGECARIPKCSCKEYGTLYLKAIKMFPGNIDASEKTLQNWRTEIPALFAFYNEDKVSGTTETSKMALFLHERQDLTQFLRLFLHSFQLPGGHLKPHDLKSLIQKGIKFKPARTIVQVLLAGNAILTKESTAKEMSLSAEEATYCIFNDTRVTSGRMSAHEIASLILENRRNRIRYYNPDDEKTKSLNGKVRTKGDMTRYAGDIFYYMEVANLLEKSNGRYYLKGNELEAIMAFAEDKTWFNGYDSFYKEESLASSSLSAVEPQWFAYVNDSMNPDLFKTDPKTVIGNEEGLDVVFDDRIREVVSSDYTTTKDIGNLGEALVCGHEKMRLKLNGYEDFVRLVQIVDSPSYHPGFDIDSYEADGTEDHRYIEVKTTISKKKIEVYDFHMSPNEWRVASTIKDHYCVYRLMLNEDEKVLFVLRNPVLLYKRDLIEAMPRDGMEITFSEMNFEPTELLRWKR